MLMIRRHALAAAFLAALTACSSPSRGPATRVLVPRVAGPAWTVARDPDLGALTDPKQEPVDFAIWQAGDGTWQLWSCIRKTRCGGKTRLFHRWEGRQLTDPDWTPMGIAMQADPTLGETPGGLQAPFVFRDGGRWVMAYGDWEHICLAESADGKSFTRRIGADGRTGMFGEGANARDPMVFPLGGLFHCYYTANPGGKGASYVRTSPDLKTWSASRVVAAGGAAGTGPWSAECPFVVWVEEARAYYLFRTQQYKPDPRTTVYRSEDPLDFGVNDDRHLVCTLPMAAPEIVRHDGQWHIAWLLPSLKGIQVARLEWAAAAGGSPR